MSPSRVRHLNCRQRKTNPRSSLSHCAAVERFFYLVIFIRAVTGVTRNAVMKINRARAEIKKMLKLDLHRREAPDGHR